MNAKTGAATGSQTTNFIYDGQDVVQDKTSSGVQADYLNRLGIDDKLRISSSQTGSLYFLKDHLASTIGLTNTSGSLIESQKYEAFGKSNLTSSLTRYGYTG